MEKLTDAIGIVLFESEKFGGEKVLRGVQSNIEYNARW